MPTTDLYLVRTGRTLWCEQKRILGRQDVSLSAEGLEQARRVVDALSGIKITEVITSPLLRASQTAECFAEKYKVDVTRDARLVDVGMGKWEGKLWEELFADDEYQAFVEERAESVDGVESAAMICDRVLASAEQSLVDNPGAGAIVMVSHSVPLRVMLASHLGMPIATFRRLQLAHGAISVIRFDDNLPQARVARINWLPDCVSAL